MSRLRIAIIALSLGVPALASAERVYESSRPEINTSHEPLSRETVRVEKPSNLRPDTMGRELVNPSNEGVDRRGIGNQEVRQGKPDLRPNPSRDSFTPARDDGSKRAAVDATREVVKKGKPMLRQDARRDAFAPVDETTGLARSLDVNNKTMKGKAHLGAGMSNRCIIAKCE